MISFVPLLFNVFYFYHIILCGDSVPTSDRNEFFQEVSILGKWIRIGAMGPVSLTFKQDGTVEANIGDDKQVEVISKYTIAHDTVAFVDLEGSLMCGESGQYRMHVTPYYLSFDLVQDNCSGRIQTTMGFWTRPAYKEFLAALDQNILDEPTPDAHLDRARIFLAVADAPAARSNLDYYIEHSVPDSRVFVNRAGTRFPQDMKGVVEDCSMALQLDNKNKNAYFLRGLARYELGEKSDACLDFSTAIDLGFSILAIAEKEKCREFWNTDN